MNVGGAGNYTWTSGQIVADVQDWLDNPDGNFGWIALGNENATQTTKRFVSKESGSQGSRPVLEITFEVAAQATATPVPPTPTSVPPTRLHRLRRPRRRPPQQRRLYLWGLLSPC